MGQGRRNDRGTEGLGFLPPGCLGLPGNARPFVNYQAENLGSAFLLSGRKRKGVSLSLSTVALGERGAAAPGGDCVSMRRGPLSPRWLLGLDSSPDRVP